MKRYLSLTLTERFCRNAACRTDNRTWTKKSLLKYEVKLSGSGLKLWPNLAVKVVIVMECLDYWIRLIFTCQFIEQSLKDGAYDERNESGKN